LQGAHDAERHRRQSDGLTRRGYQEGLRETGSHLLLSFAENVSIMRLRVRKKRENRRTGSGHGDKFT